MNYEYGSSSFFGTASHAGDILIHYTEERIIPVSVTLAYYFGL